MTLTELHITTFISLLQHATSRSALLLALQQCGQSHSASYIRNKNVFLLHFMNLWLTFAPTGTKFSINVPLITKKTIVHKGWDLSVWSWDRMAVKELENTVINKASSKKCSTFFLLTPKKSFWRLLCVRMFVQIPAPPMPLLGPWTRPWILNCLVV